MIVTIGGQSVFVATGGADFDPARPVLVLIHGAGMDHCAWAHQSRALAQGGFAVLAPDLPGHGRSGGAPLTTVAALADWVAALLDAVGVARAQIVGHSLGGLVALEFAARHGDRCDRLVVLGGAAALPVHADLLNAARDNVGAAIDMIVGWGFARPLAPSPVPGLSLTALARALLGRAAPGVLHADLAACATYGDGERAAASIGVPTVLIHGGADRMAGLKTAQALAAQVAGARLEVIGNAGHMVQMEAPGAVLAALM